VKFVLRFVTVITCIYALIVGSVTFALHNVDRFQEKIESLASSYLGQQVKISEIDTAWSGKHIGFYLEDVTVIDPSDSEIQYARIKSLAAKIDFISLLYLWPRFSEFTVEQPEILLESFSDGSFQLVGKKYSASSSTKNTGSNLQLLFEWLLSHQSADIHQGKFIFNHREGKQSVVDNLSAKYSRSPSGGHKLIVQGDYNEDVLGLSVHLTDNVFTDKNWDAQALVFAVDPSTGTAKKGVDLQVKQGQGSFQIDSFKAQRLADIVNVIGSGTAINKWLSQSQMSGELTDISFNFSGPLLSFEQWEFQANARDLSWLTTPQLPGLSKLDAEIYINESQGLLSFHTDSAELNWPQKIESSVAINQLSGDVMFQHSKNSFASQFQNIELDTPLIVVNKLNGELNKKHQQDVFLEIEGDLKAGSIQNFERFFPSNTDKQFREWWINAIGEKISAAGKLRFNGNINQDDFQSGKSRLEVDVNAENVELDYGYQQEWPVFKSDTLKVKLVNSELQFSGKTGMVGDVSLSQPSAKLTNLFSPSRLLVISSELKGELVSVIDFLQDGPLISAAAKQARSPERVDINSVSGEFFSDLSIAIPLSKLSTATVNGQGSVTNGRFMVGNLFPIESVNGSLTYSEKIVEAEGVTAQIFGGVATASVATLVPGPSIKVRINAEGEAKLSEMSQLISPQVFIANTIVSIFSSR